MKTKSITKITLLSIFVMSVITAVTLNSCQKERIAPKAVNTTNKSAGAGNVDVTSNTVINEANNIMFSMNKNEKGLIPNGLNNSSCAQVSTDSSQKPYVTTFNYGNGCTGTDGKTRAGVVIVTYDNSDIRVVNNAITTTFQNYTISGTTINGSISYTNEGPDANGNTVIAQTGTYAGVSGSETDTLNVNMAYEWLAGEYSSPAANWQFSITGSITGTSSTGNTLNITITNPLIKNSKNPTCPYYISGTMQINEGPHPSEYIDYGNPGGCSGQKSVTVNGVTTVENQ